VKIRPWRREDVDPIDRIWRAHHSSDFSVPDRRDSITDSVVVENERLIAYGQVKHFAEAMFIVDKDASRRERANALKLLMTQAFIGTRKAGLNQIYAFISDPDFALLIEKHFGFTRVTEKSERLLWEG